MGYIEENLVGGEMLIYKTRLHGWVVIATALRFIFSAILLVVSFYVIGLVQDYGNTYRTLLTLFIIGMGVLAIPVLLYGLLLYYSAEFGLTNRRVLIKTGVLRRHTLELNLGKVEGFQVSETLMGRILGFKSLVLTGSGGTRQSFQYVADADTFRRKVIEMSTQVSEDVQYGAPAFARAPAFGGGDFAPPGYRPPMPRAPLDLPTEDDPRARLESAIAAIRAGDRPTAQAIVRALIDTHADHPDVWYLVGYLSTNIDKKRDAYQKALRFDPSHAKAREALEHLGAGM